MSAAPGRPGPDGPAGRLGPLCEERIGGEVVHGAAPLGASAAASFGALSVLAGESEIAACRLEECLFLDTETTGLGGAGTLVFLCGTLRLESPGTFLLRQHFLESPGSERAFLERLRPEIEAAGLLVTFSGKSFDRHRLADRFSIHGFESTVRRARHLDLLHAARRVWKGFLPDTRLRTLEAQILGLKREADLPGALCPELYFSWLRGHWVDLEPVFFHNRLDVFSLVALLGRLGLDPSAGPVPLPLLIAHARRLERVDPLSAAPLFERAGRTAEAEACRARAARAGRRGAAGGARREAQGMQGCP